MIPSIPFPPVSPFTMEVARHRTSTNNELWGATIGALIAGGIGAFVFDHERLLGALAMALPGAVAGYFVGWKTMPFRPVMVALPAGPIVGGMKPVPVLPPGSMSPCPADQKWSNELRACVPSTCLSTDEQKQAALLACMKAANCLTAEEYRKLEASMGGEPRFEMLLKPRHTASVVPGRAFSCFIQCMEGVEAKACPGTGRSSYDPPEAPSLPRTRLFQ